MRNSLHRYHVTGLTPAGAALNLILTSRSAAAAIASVTASHGNVQLHTCERLPEPASVYETLRARFIAAGGPSRTKAALRNYLNTTQHGN